MANTRTSSGPRDAQELPDLLPPSRRKLPLWQRLLYLVLGLLCLALGILGWLLPIVTGIPFYLLGLWLLGLSSGRARRWINRGERRLPYRVRLLLRRIQDKGRRRKSAAH